MIDHIALYSNAIARCVSDDEFDLWFNRTGTANNSRVNGFWDFANHIATPKARFHLGNPQDKVALEIGCGGGRMLAAASYFFRRVIGLDIHASLDRVRGQLDKRGIRNFDLIRGDGMKIPLPAKSVDFVYSFIVFQHLQSFDAFVSYVKETHRCLKHGGLAHLYYAKKIGGVKEASDYEANGRSLSMGRNDAVGRANDIGFELLEECESWCFSESELIHGCQGSMLLRR